MCRSLTGPGLRQTLARIGEVVPLRLHELPSGTELYDWQVPDEWAPRAAYVETLGGERLVDFADSNLHLVQYSPPVDAVVPWEELRPRLHTLPNQPDALDTSTPPTKIGYFGYL